MSTDSQTSRVIVVGNEKGGSGKSTVAMHVAIGLLKAGYRVATIDLDSHQRTFTNYIESRQAWAQHIGRELEMPDHHRFDEPVAYANADEEAAANWALTNALEPMTKLYNFVVIDTPGHRTTLSRLAHSLADTLVTPLNDSFVDLDVIGTVDAATLGVTGASHYGDMVRDARREREARDGVTPDWVVVRNRLSMLQSRNKRAVAEGLQTLSQMLDFRTADGLAERLIFREFYPRGLTALDTLDAQVLGTRPTLSHATARLEVDNLLKALRLVSEAAPVAQADAALNAA
jgi:chromosome partitioning protein